MHIVPNLKDDDNDVTTDCLYMTDAEFLAIKGLVLAQSDTEITSCVPPPNPLYPDITHVYTSATKFRTLYSYHLPVLSHRGFFLFE